MYNIVTVYIYIFFLQIFSDFYKEFKMHYGFE